MYHGWNDTAISPQNSIELLQQRPGEDGQEPGDFIRLFMVPGWRTASGVRARLR
jgi:feruloyl esterase